MTIRFRSCVLALLVLSTLAHVATLANAAVPPSENERLIEETAAAVLPGKGYQSRIMLGDSVIKLVREGIIDVNKFDALYAKRGGLPDELKDVLNQPSTRPVLLTAENAAIYVNLLWPLGLANRMAANTESPLNGSWRYSVASTGGWTLGREKNGGTYFNKFPIVRLTRKQEALVIKVARNTYRPCCDNSTFFQDCNHGSALLGLLALGAAQGLTEDELYQEALTFNAFWFPSQYVHTALYFKAVRGVRWQDVDAREALSGRFSSASGWQANVAAELARRGLLPQAGNGNCGA